MQTLKEEWIERIKKIERRQVYPERGGFFTAMTDFYKAPEEIRNDKEMCLKVLLESGECIWNVPEEIRTIEFLEDLIEKGYKGNILYAKHDWPEEDFPFIKKYLARFDKMNKPKFNIWYNTRGIFDNREMVLSLVKDDNFQDSSILIKRYNKDKEIMFALLDNHPQYITDMLKSIKNAYFKNQGNIFKILEYSTNLYNYIPEKFQKIDEVIDYILPKDSSLFASIPEEISENREKAFSLIKKYKNIRGKDIYFYKDDYEIAKFMIERNGSDFTIFNFIKNDELIRLAAKTYDNISYIPATQDYEPLIREVVLRANKDFNEINFSITRGNIKKAEMVKDLLPQLLKEEKIYNKTVAQFFESFPTSENQVDYKYRKSNLIIEKELFIECIKVSHYVYEKIDSEYKRGMDIDILNYYVGSAKAAGEDPKRYIPTKYKEAAEALKVDVEKYIFNEFLTKQLTPLPKAKVSKI